MSSSYYYIIIEQCTIIHYLVLFISNLLLVGEAYSSLMPHKN